MADVLFVSKPVAPPWNDSSKNLARDVAGHLERHRATVMVSEKDPDPPAPTNAARVFGNAAGRPFASTVRQRVDVLKHLLWGPRPDLWHFFFAPSGGSSAAGRFAQTMRRVPCVHTWCSMPDGGASPRKLMFADVTVALSRHAYDWLDSHVNGHDVRRIPPSVPALPTLNDEQRNALRERHGVPSSACVWIYPGDLEHGSGGELAIQALAAKGGDDVLLMACRDKTRRAPDCRRDLQALARRLHVSERTRWVGETPYIHELVALSDAVVLPSRSSFAKMDYPLVALEAMSMERPVFVSTATPARELAVEGAAVAVEPDAEALANAVESHCADRAALRALGRRARELALGPFSPRRVAAEYEKIYDEIHV